MQPSASCLYYLFSDRVLRRPTWWQRLSGDSAVIGPSSGGLVGLGLLERRLLAVALWALIASHRIRISWAQPGDGRLRPSGFLNVRAGTYVLRLHRGQGLAGVSGLEADLLAGVPGDGTDIHGLVNEQWLHGGSLPINGMIVPVQQEALDLGLLVYGESIRSRRRSLRWSDGLHDLRAAHEQLAMLEDPFDELVGRLDSFARSERELWSRVISEGGKALADARPTPMGSTSGG